jgi:hypothetical protein
MKTKKLWMVREGPGDCEFLRFYNLVFAIKRPAKPEDETLEAMADMLDMAAEDCNAHDFVNAHHAVAIILHQEVGREAATRVMRRLVNYEGLYGLVGSCGKGSKRTVERELKMSLYEMPQVWYLPPAI